MSCAGSSTPSRGRKPVASPRELGPTGCRVGHAAAEARGAESTAFARASLEKSTVVLTLIGGGVFSNPKEDIWEAIEFAIETVKPYLRRAMLVIVNCREGVEPSMRKKILAGGGAFVEFGEHGISVRKA